MDKDYKYWNAHKAIYNELLNELDNSIIMKITTNGVEVSRSYEAISQR